MNTPNVLTSAQLTNIVGGDGEDDGAGFAPLSMPPGWDAGIEYMLQQLEILWNTIQTQNLL